MKIITLVDKVFSTNNHIIISNGEGVLVDATVRVAEIKKALVGAPLKAILLTHAHFDHITSVEEIKAEFNCPVFVHEKGYTSLFSAEENLSSGFTPFEITDKANIIKVKDNEELLLFNTPIKVLHTPGHSHCSVCYEIGDYLFTGDTLFSACIGRNDFWHSNATHQQSSLKKLLHLPPKTKYFSGHGHSFDYNRAVRVINKYLE